MPIYGDYNSTSVFYLRKNLCFNFFVETPVDINGKKEDIMSNISIFMRITNVFLPNLPITSTGSDYKNDSYTSNLTSDFYIELVNANLQTVDLFPP
jgi:hypothetical protein